MRRFGDVRSAISLVAALIALVAPRFADAADAVRVGKAVATAFTVPIKQVSDLTIVGALISHGAAAHAAAGGKNLNR